MYKVIKIMMSVLMFLVTGMSQRSIVSAADLSGEFKYGSETPYYIVSETGSHGSASNTLNYKLVKRTGSSTWVKAFCMEPGKNLTDGVALTPSQYTKTRIARLAYLGYYSQQNAKNYINTQALIYEELGDKVSYVSTENYDTFKKNILAKYEKFDTKPVFNGSTIQVAAGKSVTITDTNKVLSDYKTFTVTQNGITLSHTKGQNTMTVTVSKSCTVAAQKFSDDVIKAAGGYKFDSRSDVNIYYKNSGQDIAVFGNVDAITMNVTIDVEYSALNISKVDEKGNAVKDVTFEVSYNSDMSSPIGTYTTNTNGMINITNLAPGKVYVREKSVPEYLVLDNSIHEVTLTVNQTASCKIVNTIKKGRIVVTKKDSDSNKTVLKEGTEFEIYNSANELVETMKTNEKGEAVSSLLEYGTYSIKESKAPAGYVLNLDKFNVNISSDGQDYHVSILDKPIQGRITIEKTGEVLVGYENGKFIYDKLGLAGMKAEVIAYEDILDCADGRVLYKKGETVATVITDESGKVIVNVPLGKYKVKEVVAPQGYILSDQEYIVELTEDKVSDGIVTSSVRFYNNRQKVQITAIKNDEKQQLLPDATIGLYAKEDIVNYKGEVLVKKDILIESGKTNEKGVYNFTLDLPLVSFYLKEMKAPEGYVLSSNQYIVPIEVKDQKTIQYTYEIELSNQKTKVQISKVDIVDGKEIPGAHLEIRDMSDNLIDSWISTDEPHFIEGLQVNKSYKLIETLPAAGYVTAESITFTVKETKDIQKVVMKDDITKMEISKTDITGDKEISGAHLEVIDDQGKVVDSWISDDKPHMITKLTVGKTYKLVEKLPADGYVTAESIDFTILDSGEVQKVVMKDAPTQVEIQKVDTEGHQIVGAELVILDKDTNEVVDTFKTTKESMVLIGKLIVGKTYILRELSAPDGYAVSKDVEFVVEDKENIQSVEMVDKKISALKVNVDGHFVSGAKLQVVSAKTKNIIDEWLSDGSEHVISGLMVGQEYILKEILAPEGYAKAEDVYFKVKDDKSHQKIVMINKQVTVSKLDITNGNELEGAEIIVVNKETNKEIDRWISTKEPHAIKGLEENKNYILTEITAPYGYTIAESIEFSVSGINEKGIKINQHIEMKDDYIYTDLKVNKLDSDTKEIIDKEVEFTLYADKTCKQEMKSYRGIGSILFKDLKYGTYYLKETKAPKGYQLSHEIVEIVIDDKNNKNIEIDFTNQLNKTVSTGDSQRIIVYVVGMIIPVSYLMIMKYLKKKNG